MIVVSSPGPGASTEFCRLRLQHRAAGVKLGVDGGLVAGNASRPPSGVLAIFLAETGPILDTARNRRNPTIQ